VRDVAALLDRHGALELDGTAASCSKNGVPAPSRTGTRSTQISSSSPRRGTGAIVPPLTPTSFSPTSSLATATARSILGHEGERRVLPRPALRHAVGEHDHGSALTAVMRIVICGLVVGTSTSPLP